MFSPESMRSNAPETGVVEFRFVSYGIHMASKRLYLRLRSIFQSLGIFASRSSIPQVAQLLSQMQDFYAAQLCRFLCCCDYMFIQRFIV